MEREIISELKWALGTFDEPMSWQSADGFSLLKARPVFFSNENREEVPYGRLRDMPMFRLGENMNVWALARITNQREQGNLLEERMILQPGYALIASAVGSFAMLEDGVQGDFARNSHSDELQRAIEEPSKASIRDYANLFNAVHDLQPVTEQKIEEHLEYLRNMTKEDMRNARAMKRDWLVAPELDKTAVPKFWGITYGSQVWLVKASSAEEAVLDLEDHFEMGLEPLFMFFTDPYDDMVQEELATKYEDGGIRRLIPYSLAEWPDDPNNLSEEQQAAVDKIEAFNKRYVPAQENQEPGLW